MNYFFHQSIKNYTIALLDLFNDIHVPRFDNNGSQIQDIVVPIKFGNKDKAYMLSDYEIENLHTGNVNILPRMVLEFNGMSKAQDRDTNKLSKINKRRKEDLLYNYHYNAVAYDFNYTIYIATRTFTDATIIVEQIAPMFRPDLTLKIQELDIQFKPTSVPVTLEDFSFTLPEDLGEDEIRIIEVEFPLVVKGNLYLPISDQSIIEELKVNLEVIESQRTELTEKYELDFETNVLASTITSGIDEELIPSDTEDIERAQDDSNIDIEHYENSGDVFADNLGDEDE